MITNTKKASLWNKLKDRKFRDAFVVSQFKRSIPFQITALRKKLEWSQEQLADAAKVTQGVISRAENPNYGNLTLNTVLRVANGLDVGVVIEFVPFSRLVQIFEDRSEDQAPIAFEVEDKALATTVTKEEKESESLAPAGLRRVIGQASETDIAQPITHLKSYVVAQVTETDTAQSISVSLKTIKDSLQPIPETVSAGPFAGDEAGVLKELSASGFGRQNAPAFPALAPTELSQPSM